MSDYYNPSSVPANGAFGSSNTIRSEFAAISTGISDKLPPLTGAANKVVVINGTASGQTTQATNGTGNIVRETGAAIDLTNATNVPSAQLTGLAAGIAAFLATPSSANLRTALTDETGSGSAVFATSPSLVSPALGTPASGTLTNTTGFPASQLAGLGSGVASFLAAPSSANLAAALTDETGSGAAVFANSPSLTTPNLGTPSAINLANASNFPAAAITGILAVANGGTGTNVAEQLFLGGANYYRFPNGLTFKFGNVAGTTDANGRITVFFNSIPSFTTIYTKLCFNTNSAATKAIPIADTLGADGVGSFNVVWTDGVNPLGAGVAVNISYLLIGAS